MFIKHHAHLAAIAVVFALTATGMTSVTAQAQNFEEEEKGPTPVSDFAPDEVRSSRREVYDEGVTINRVSIEGNKLITEENIKDSMAIRPGSLYSKNTLQKDLRRIYDMGYFTEKIRAVPVATNRGIHLRIQVEENAPVTGVDVTGNSVVKDSEIMEVFSEQTGMPQNIGQLNESIEKIEQLYADKGYILARVNNIQDDPDGVINLEINEGRINKVYFVGNRKTRENVVRRVMATKDGDVYNEKLLADDLKRLYSLQSFSDVRRVISVSPENPDEYDLTVELDEKKTGAISLGGGLDTGTGVFGSVGYTDPNFLGRGQNFRSVFSVGTGTINRGQFQANTRTYQFEVGWTNPSLFESVNALDVNAYGRDLSSFNVPLAIERRIGTAVTWSRPILSKKNTSFSLALGGERVSLREGGSASDLARFGANPNRTLDGGTFVNITPTLAFDSRNNRFNPNKGWYNTVSLTGAYGLSGDSYGTANVNLRKYIKIWKDVTLAVNTQAGSSLLGNVPDFNMFRMGGAYSVRGYQEGGLGVGSGFLLASAEVRSGIPFLSKFEKLKALPIANSLKTAFFVDAGTLIDESDNNATFGLAGSGASIGAGIRFNIPGVGPIRVDYALPLSGGNSDYTRRINFGVGNKF
ncbi:MAG: BamA/TamA family outer membrane protein [Vampirovibrio sp.]|nr:BamA/TamA family outer membrane protein [Vampirovibrio sp.]